MCTPIGFKSRQFRNPELSQALLAVRRLAISILICANGAEDAVSKQAVSLNKKTFLKKFKKKNSTVTQAERRSSFAKRGQHKHTLQKCLPVAGPSEKPLKPRGHAH